MMRPLQQLYSVSIVQGLGNELAGLDGSTHFLPSPPLKEMKLDLYSFVPHVVFL
jgi:hypothetical protein